jgi:uncharacterized protein with beta-barrel porin domain
MQNKIRKLLTSAGLGLGAAVLLLLCISTQAMGAGTDTAGNIARAQGSATLVTAVDFTNGIAWDADITTHAVDSVGGTIILGTVANKSAMTFANNTSNAAAINFTTSGTALANLVTVAGDVVGGHSGDTYTLNITNTNAIFTGDIGGAAGAAGSGTFNMVIGQAAGSGLVMTTTFDTATNANLLVDSHVDAKHADNTITMAITNSSGEAANKIAFAEEIGATSPIDVISFGAEANALFSKAVTATTITMGSARTATFTKLVTGDLNFTADGTMAFVSTGIAGVIMTGAINNTTGNALQGTLTIADQSTAVIVSGAVGATNTLKAITVDGTAGNATTFTNAVRAGTLTFTGNGAADSIVFNGTANEFNLAITGDGIASFGADDVLTGNVTAGTDGNGLLTFAAAAASKTLVTGSVGATGGSDDLKSFTAITSVGNTTTLASGDMYVLAVVLSGAGTAHVAGNWTGTTLTTDTGNTVTTAASSVLTGNILTGTDGAGTLTFADTITDKTLVTGDVGASGGSDDLLALNVNVADTKTATITGKANALTITVNGLGKLAVGGNVLGDIVLAGGGLFELANNAISGTGNITTATTNTGTLSLVNGTQSVAGTIGTTGNRLKLITQAGTGTATLNDDVFATNTTINSTGGITMGAGDLLTSDVYFDANGTLTITDGVTGAVTTEVDDTGTVATAAAGSITGTLGASGLVLSMVDIGHATTITGNVYATEVDIGADALSMSANADITGAVDISASGAILNLADGADVTGTIIPSAGNHGTVNVAGTSTISGVVGNVGSHDLLLLAVGGSGKLTLGGGFEGTQITVATGGVLNYTSATTAHTGNLIVTGTGTVNVGTTTTTVSGTLTMPNTSTLKVSIGTTNGKLVHSTAVSAFTTTALLEPVIAGRITSGTAITVFAGAAAPNLPVVTDNYARYTFALAVCNVNDLCLTPTLVAKPAGVTAAGAAVNAVADVAFASDTAMNDALQGLSGATLDKALVSLAPSVSGGAIVGAVSAGAASGATISTQIASLRGGIAAGSGLNAGDGTEEKRFWTQGFGSYAEQDMRETINGFTSSTGGVAFGIDRRMASDTVLGGAYSFSHTNVDTKLSRNATKVAGHQATLYGTHDFDKGIFGVDGVFLDGQLSYAYNDYTSSRYIDVGAVARKADSDFDGSQISTKFDLGRTINLSDNFRITPTAGISYTHVNIDSYTETGAGASGLNMAKQDYDILSLNLKGKLARTIQINGADVTPEVHLGYSYETIHDQIQTTSTFTGGGASFQSTGFETADHTVLGGLGVTFSATQEMPIDLTFTYDASVKDDFTGHSGLVKGSYRF